MSREIDNQGWSMFPTFLPGEQLRVEPAHPSDLEPGDVAALFGDEYRVADGEFVTTGRQLLLTHRVLAIDAESVLLTADLSPSSRWEQRPTDDAIGRVVGVETRADPEERELIRILWYWEQYARVAFNCAVQSKVERLCPLLERLAEMSVERLERGPDGDSPDEVSAAFQPGANSVRDLAESAVELYEKVEDALAFASERGQIPDERDCACSFHPGRVQFCTLPTETDAVERVIRDARRSAETVLPTLPVEETGYPTIDEKYALTPCSDCDPSAPTCRTRSEFAFEGATLTGTEAPYHG